MATKPISVGEEENETQEPLASVLPTSSSQIHPLLNVMPVHKLLSVALGHGIMLEYEKGGELKTKSIDLLELSPSTDVNTLVEEIQKAEPLITVSRAQQVRLLVQRLQEKLRQHCDHSFYLFKVLRAHILPLTNVALNKAGSCFITGSYDRTCKVWDTASGEELHTLEGHRNVVYAIAFNNPYGYVHVIPSLLSHSRVHPTTYW
ncbi:dynein assembly factor with WDR repeat domains 1 isoform X2, partial [Cricetulus griseus]|uniref:dynein assembly factor with WDR repeat domains 1 isoform X2 n=1 Tax=Cricetulus griseus TaxID=10029 RepID=UPI0015C2FA6F